MRTEKIQDIYALSPMQAGMLFHTLYSPESAVYLEQHVYALGGRPDLGAFERAWQYLVERHTALRTSFHWEGLKEPRQVVHTGAEIPLEQRDWRGHSAELQSAALEAFLTEDRAQGIDLGRAPLMRLTLIRTGDESWQFVWTHHHLLLDRWAVSQVLGELTTAYDALVQGRRIELPPVRPYGDYIGWLQAQDPVRAESYWRRTLAGFTSPTALPIDRTPGGLPGEGISASVERQLSEETSTALRTLARQHRLTPNTLVQGAWALLLARYSGEQTVAFGATVSGRPASLSGVESMVGLFINSLPVRVEISERESLLGWLHKLQEEMLALRDYEYSALVQIQGWSEVPRGTPLFDSLVVVQNSGADADPQESGSDSERDGGLRLRSVTARSSADFPLYLIAAPERQWLLRLSYEVGRYQESDIVRLLGHLSTVLEGFASDPHRSLTSVPMLTAPEQHQLLVEWNETSTEVPQKQTLDRLFEEQVDRTPDAVALQFGEEQVTYSQLNRSANWLAHYLRTQGVGPGVVVGVCLERSIEMYVGLLGILKAGGAYVPLDPANPRERQAAILEEVSPALILSDARSRTRLEDLPVRILCLDTDPLPTASDCFDNLRSAATSEDLAYVMFTSGSTGRPKGVAVPHCAVTRLVCRPNYCNLGPEEVILQFAPLAFDASTFEIWGSLLNGGCLVPLVGQNVSLEDLGDTIRRAGVTTLWLTAGLFHAMAEEHLEALQGVRQLLAGGDVLSPVHVERTLRGLPECRLINGYGPTENTTFTCCHGIESGLEPGSEGLGSIPIGRPITHTQVYILDPHMKPVPVGVTGELYAGGEGLAWGYWNHAELTAEKFVPNPFSGQPGARLYRTGDRVRYLADGAIEFLGRADHQVKIRGFRIEPGEIESVLLQHPSVREVLVLTREDEPGDKRLVAYVVGEDGAVGMSALRDYLSERLPAYMVPAAFVHLDAFPLTANGKIDRKALPAPARRAEEQAIGAPHNPIEAGIMDIWRMVLRLEQVSRYDSFFELGGHSLLATQIISRIRNTFQVELPLRALFEAPTVVELAEQILQRKRGEAGEAAPALLPGNRTEQMPLSFSQQRLWLLEMLEPGTAVYTIPIALQLVGPLDVPALERGLREIVQRHEALRTTFAVVENEPVQIIGPASGSLVTEDLRTLSGQERARQTQARIAVELQRPFDLEHGPLFRSLLLRSGDEEHTLLLTMHHIVSDAWSQDILMRELTALYSAYSHGQPSPLSPLELRYSDYAVWQRNWLQGEALERQLDYWKAHLNGVPALLDLPTDRPRPTTQTFRGALKRLELPQELTAGLKALGLREGTTLFMTLLAAFQALLARYSGQDDIVVGTPIANRTRSEVEGLVGFFVNTLPLRGDLSGDPTFRELLKRVREAALGGYAHQDLPFEKLVEEMQSERSLSYSPLFQVMFVLQNAAYAGMELEGVQIEEIEAEWNVSKFDLSLFLSESKGELHGALEYSTDLFDSETIERLLGHFRTLLEGIVTNPAERISRLPMLSPAERHQLLVEWNQTAAEYPQEACLHQLFEAQVARTPRAVALIHQGQSLTYHQLNTQANQLAHLLKSRGIGPDTLVALCMTRGLDMVVSLLAILKAGAAYVALDPAYPQERLRTTLQDAEAALLLTQEALLPLLPQTSTSVLCLEQAKQEAAQQPSDNPVVSLLPSNLAYVLYTSGSTGVPKGVAITHRSPVALVSWAHGVFSAAELARVVCATSICFDLSVFELFVPLCAGGAVLLVENAIAIGELEAGSSPTLINTVPSAMAELLRQRAVPSSVLTVNLAGEPLTSSLVDAIYAQTGVEKVYDLYGPSEDTTYSTWALRVPGGRVTIGRPISNSQAYVLDGSGQPVAVGVAGELYLGGEGLARGYLHRPELTAEKFVPDPFSGKPGGRLYRTGDLVKYLPDGHLQYLGRLDHQVKIRGFRIELGEIESVLLQHPSVREAIVLAREDDPGNKRLVAYVVGEDASLSSSALREHLLSKLPAYMVPTALLLLDALPLTPNGKVDRKALPAPEGGGGHLDAESYVAARTPIEEGLAAIWSEVLGLERVSLYANFFDLGGHSLLATQVISRVRSTFSVELALRTLFEAPTVAQLAERIGLARGDAGALAPPMRVVSREGALPLSFSQQRLWFLDQFEPGSSVYNLPMALRLTGALDVSALERSLQEIVRRHEALRTTFTMVDVEPVQNPSNALGTLTVLNLSGLSVLEREREADRYSAEEARRPFDLGQGPLFRATLLILGDEEHRLLMTMHHIVSDAWSIGILMGELETLYNAFHLDQPSPLTPLPIQYADYAAWQREWLQGEVLERQIAYWKQHLQGAPALLELPTDRPRPPMQTFRGAITRRELSAELTQRIKALCRQEDVTLFMTLLAAYQTLLARYSGQDQIVVGTPIANRTRSEVEGLVGFFVNTLPLRGDLSGDPTFRELLKRVREAALGGYAHQDLPFEKLVEEMQSERSLSYSPLFQVLFTLQNVSAVRMKLGEIHLDDVSTEGTSAKYDLSLALSESDGQLLGRVEYNTDLFDGDRMERMLAHFQSLLEAVVADPAQRISCLPLLTESERNRLLVEWNATGMPYPQDRCLHQLFEAQVERTPEAVALVFDEQHLTYRELNSRANQVAHYLRAQGVGPEAPVGLCVERSLNMFVGLLGILKAGGAYVPLDPAYPAERLAFILEDCRAVVLVTDDSCPRIPLDNPVPIVHLGKDVERIARESTDNPSNQTTSENLAYVIYTSGSTGTPKGVQVPHGSVCNLVGVLHDAFRMEPTSRVLQFANLSFDASVEEWAKTLTCGATLHLARREEVADVARLLQILQEQKITTVTLPPTYLALLEQSMAPDLRTLCCAGEACPPELAARWQDRVHLLNGYGPTEATVAASYYRVLGMAADAVSVPIGKPNANVTLYLLDRHMQPVPVGVEGELYIGGAGLTRGYLNRPDLTAKKFVPNPFSREAGARLYRTSDRGRYLSDGNIEYLGRVDDQVKIRGFRIELGEIESVLSQHPAVREAVVTVREDVPGDRRLVAYLVGSEEAGNPSALREHLREKLPAYMIPAAFVLLEALPLSSNGKVDRKALPATDFEERTTTYVAPGSAVEEALAQIFGDVLHQEQVSIHDSFFDLGGHSLLATQVIARIAQVLQIDVRMPTLFAHPTVSGLSVEIEESLQSKAEQEEDEIERLLRELENLSDEEAQERLAGGLL